MKIKYQGGGRFEVSPWGNIAASHSAHWTQFIRRGMRKIFAPLFCIVCGHTWEQGLYCYDCKVCGKRD